MSNNTKTLYYVIKRGNEYCAPYQTRNWMKGDIFGSDKKLAVRFVDRMTADYYLSLAKMHSLSLKDYDGTRVVRVFKRLPSKKSR